MIDTMEGVIKADECYTLDAVKRRMGLKDEALRQAFRNGLPSKRIGNRKYILGRDILQYLDDQDDALVETVS